MSELNNHMKTAVSGMVLEITARLDRQEQEIRDLQHGQQALSEQLQRLSAGSANLDSFVEQWNGIVENFLKDAGN